MRDIGLELIVGLALGAVGAFVVYLVVGDGVWSIDPHWLYAIGAVVVAISTIVVLERRRRSVL